MNTNGNGHTNEFAVERITDADTLDLYGFAVTPQGLTPSHEVSLPEWATAFDALTGAYQGIQRKASWIQFALGDLLLYGEQHYGEQVYDYLDPHAYEFHTLQNFKSVARAFPNSLRRESLSWSHHASVAGLDGDTRDDLMERAEKEDWTVARMNEERRGAQGKPPSGEIECPNCHTRFSRSDARRIDNA